MRLHDLFRIVSTSPDLTHQGRVRAYNILRITLDNLDELGITNNIRDLYAARTHVASALRQDYPYVASTLRDIFAIVPLYVASRKRVSAKRLLRSDSEDDDDDDDEPVMCEKEEDQDEDDKEPGDDDEEDDEDDEDDEEDEEEDDEEEHDEDDYHAGDFLHTSSLLRLERKLDRVGSMIEYAGRWAAFGAIATLTLTVATISGMVAFVDWAREART